MSTTTRDVMTTQEITDRLSELFNEGKWAEAHNELFSKDAKSIEPLIHRHGFG